MSNIPKESDEISRPPRPKKGPKKYAIEMRCVETKSFYYRLSGGDWKITRKYSNSKDRDNALETLNKRGGFMREYFQYRAKDL